MKLFHSDNLPKTAYIKMIDIWMIFSLLKPFVDIIVQTYIETQKHEDNKKEIQCKAEQRWDFILLEFSINFFFY